MGERPGPFARFLAISSGLLFGFAALIALFSHPLGIFVSIMIVGGWFHFVKLLNFLSGSGGIIPEVESPAPPQLPQRGPEEYARRIALIAERIRQQERAETPTSRVLWDSARARPEPPSALVRAIREGRISQSQDDLRAERKEDAEWADMFRAL